LLHIVIAYCASLDCCLTLIDSVLCWACVRARVCVCRRRVFSLVATRKFQWTQRRCALYSISCDEAPAPPPPQPPGGAVGHALCHSQCVKRFTKRS